MQIRSNLKIIKQSNFKQMGISRFGASFVGALVKPGTKVQESLRPEIMAVSTKDKFVVNAKARQMLNLADDGRIAMLDAAQNNGQATNMNDRFYVIPNYVTKSGSVIGAKLGKGASYSYAGIWSAIMVAKMDVFSAQPEDLVREGKAIIREKEAIAKDGTVILDKLGKPVIVSNCIATQKVHFEVVPVLNEEGVNLHVVDTEGTEAPVFALTNMEVYAHEPRENGSDDDETEAEAEADATVANVPESEEDLLAAEIAAEEAAQAEVQD